jgi:hypothetical protein
VTPASFPFYTTGEDNLRVTSYNTATGVSLKINGRLLDATGRANADTWDHTPNTDRSAKVTDITLSGSTFLNLTRVCERRRAVDGANVREGRIDPRHRRGAIVLGTVLQGYVTATQAIGWPGSPLQTAIDSGGYYRTIIGTKPAAGAAIVETVPVGARWSLISLLAQITTVASGSVRPVYLRFADSVPTGEAPTVAVAGNGTNTIFSWMSGYRSPSTLAPPSTGCKDSRRRCFSRPGIPSVSSRQYPAGGPVGRAGVSRAGMARGMTHGDLVTVCRRPAR